MGLVNTGPFTNLEPNTWWTGTRYFGTSFSGFADPFMFSMASGEQDFRVMAHGFLAVAVTDGDIAGTVPEPASWALMLAGMFAVWGLRVRKPSRQRSVH